MKSVFEKIDFYRNNFIAEYGKDKYLKIFDKIHNSKKFKNLIDLSAAQRLVPNKNDYVYRLNGIPYFMFCKGDTITMGAIIAFEMWHNKVNFNNSFADENQLNAIYEGMMRDCEKFSL